MKTEKFFMSKRLDHFSQNREEISDNVIAGLENKHSKKISQIDDLKVFSNTMWAIKAEQLLMGQIKAIPDSDFISMYKRHKKELNQKDLGIVVDNYENKDYIIKFAQ